MSSLTKKEKRDLSILSGGLSLSVSHAMEAAMVTMAASAYFAQDPEHKSFAWNPVNMFPYAALKALEDRSIVEITEQLKDEHKMIPASFTIRRKAELLNHRDVLSHTMKLKWGRPGLQEFYDSHKQWTDLRAALVWDMWRSFNEHLVAAGEPPKYDAVRVGGIHATMVHGILRYALKPEAVPAMPTEEAILGQLRKFANDFLDFLVVRPDGVTIGARRSAPPDPAG